MRIRYKTPLASYQILQRDADNHARVLLTATDQIVVLPAGGPYTLESACEIYVGDLFILAGQSNMEGYGNLGQPDAEETSEPGLHSFQTREDWAIAEDPLHWIDESPYLIDHRLRGRAKVPDQLPPRDANRTKGVGPGMSFAKEYRLRSGGVPVGLIPSAHGGTSMQQWDPQLVGAGGRSLYGAMLERFRKVGGKVRGIVWYQGESDALEMEQSVEYADRMSRFVAAVRHDMGDSALGFWFAQLGRVVWGNSKVPWNTVREAQRRLTDEVGGAAIAVVSTTDLELDEFIHIGARGQRRLGRRLALAALGKRGPRLASVECEGGATIRVSFADVYGGLVACGLPAGFSVRTGAGKALPLIYKIILDGNDAVLFLAEALPAGVNVFLWYAFGNDPYCNITDAEDCALLAFGPVVI